jgi:hypothetical protein
MKKQQPIKPPQDDKYKRMEQLRERLWEALYAQKM